jgi:transposase InsO family protein
VATATNYGGIYKVDVVPQRAYTTVKAPDSQELLHKRLGHLNWRSMTLLRKGMAGRVQYSDLASKPCIPCIEGKQNRLPFSKSGAQRARQVLELVHSDLCGPMSEVSWSGARYLFVLIDDFTRMTFGYFLKTKDEVKIVFQEFKAMVENQTGHSIKVLSTYNGTEYVNREMDVLLRTSGIRHQTTVPHTPEQNGAAKRANRTIMEKARCMIQDSKLGVKFGMKR